MPEFIKPDLDGRDWEPSTVCTDKNGFTYTSWKSCILNEKRFILLQYYRGDRRVLTEIPLDSDSNCMTTIEQDDGEFLMVVTLETRNTAHLQTHTEVELEKITIAF